MKRFINRIKFLGKIHKSIPFLFDFFFSKDVNLNKKLIFVIVIIGYFLLPFDIIPDFLLFFGLVDDTAVLLFLLQQMVKVAPTSLKEKHGL
ncbi:DUF1232 domain-containing protein [Oceanobacillus piezotolerans]|uniref:DUF1232 domain-containing protein n=1 Tax=Oceanobacillus piezotolerans TaxID=2448030 RepID=A0A498D7T6_9BACI|nr:DUF1232 domain-containing protein [Oceanobacillus piezotolerans]RLL42114.1 DUF1232 domain-containing protein [Oceanobacillus piezotolerans]